MPDSLSLSALMSDIAEAISSAMPDVVWLRAELSEVRRNANGHCYLTFVEKDAQTGQLLAQCKAVIWARQYWLIQESFERATGQSLQPGMKVLVKVTINLSPAYGLSLFVWDIDPSYTLGEMAQRRQEIINRLTQEGMIDMNRQLPFPRLPQRIAIVSAEGAAGYGDFCNQLLHNEWQAAFYPKLFPAVMQGDQTESSVIKALDRIYAHADLFDVVVIIRGGGGTVDLASFDSYNIAVNVANFPLPVLTGIGHERDTTVLDAVAHTSVKTPTAAAAFLIDKMGEQISQVETLSDTLIEATQQLLQSHRLRLSQSTLTLANLRSSRIAPLHQQLSILQERLHLLPTQRIQTAQTALTHLQELIALVQPDHILQRGFSITRVDGHVVTSSSQVPAGSTLETQLADGVLTSKILR